jgi:hypothetical protein
MGVNVDGCCSARQLTASSILIGSEIVASSTLGGGGGVSSQDAGLLLFHVREHFWPAGSEKPHEKKRCNGQKNNIQNGRIIEADRHLDDLSTTLRRNHAQQVEKKFDHERGENHRNIKNCDDEAGAFPAVIPRIKEPL